MELFKYKAVKNVQFRIRASNRTDFECDAVEILFHCRRSHLSQQKNHKGHRHVSRLHPRPMRSKKIRPKTWNSAEQTIRSTKSLPQPTKPFSIFFGANRAAHLLPSPSIHHERFGYDFRFVPSRRQQTTKTTSTTTTTNNPSRNSLRSWRRDMPENDQADQQRAT